MTRPALYTAELDAALAANDIEQIADLNDYAIRTLRDVLSMDRAELSYALASERMVLRTAGINTRRDYLRFPRPADSVRLSRSGRILVWMALATRAALAA